MPIEQFKTQIAAKNIINTPQGIFKNKDFEERYPVEIINMLREFEELENIRTVELTNTDFTNGTFRIKTPGKYILKEDIIFEPNKDTDFQPTNAQITGENPEYPVAPSGAYGLGFFAAITIESDNVIVDLNGFSIQQSAAFYLDQRFYSNIELNSSPFRPLQGPANFGTTFKNPKNIHIKNGCLGLSSHHGIHGNNASNVLIENVDFVEFEVAAIALNGSNCVLSRNLNITKSSGNIRLLSTYSQGRFIRKHLKRIIEREQSQSTFNGQSGQTILNKLETALVEAKNAVLTHDKTFNSVFTSNTGGDGNIYGMLFNISGVVIGPFIETRGPESVNENIYIQDVIISDLKSHAIEVLGLNSEPSTEFTYSSKKLQTGPAGDVIEFPKIQENGVYKPNVLSDAQFFIKKTGLTQDELGTTSISDKFLQWAEGGITFENLIGYDEGKHHYVTGGDSMGHSMKGNIGLFLSGVKNCQVENLEIKNVGNTGNHHSKIPSEVKDSCEIYLGASSTGITLAACESVQMRDIMIEEIYSEGGVSIGVDVRKGCEDINVFGLNVKRINSSNHMSIPEGDRECNPRSKPYAHRIEGNTKKIYINK
jgi:hypothetical protein